MKPITHTACREARLRLGLSTAKMAPVLGLSDGRAVRRYEADPDTTVTARTPTGALEVLYRAILSGKYRPA